MYTLRCGVYSSLINRLWHAVIIRVLVLITKMKYALLIFSIPHSRILPNADASNLVLLNQKAFYTEILIN